MTDHEYSPEDALEVLLNKVRERDEDLYFRIKEEIDKGKDVSKEQELSAYKIRKYREISPYSEQEALDVALHVLRSCFIEIPTFINSAYQEFSQVYVDSDKSIDGIMNNANEMRGRTIFASDVVIYPEIETEIISREVNEFVFTVVDRQLNEQMENIKRLENYLDFGSEDK